MTLNISLSRAQAFALRDALATAARNLDHDLELDPIWEATCNYCEQRLQAHLRPAIHQP